MGNSKAVKLGMCIIYFNKKRLELIALTLDVFKYHSVKCRNYM